jgi:hypothetical protein
MDDVSCGDIFPARQAIALIDQVDLGVPIEIPPVPPEAEPADVPADEHRWLLSEIVRRNTRPRADRAHAADPLAGVP